MTTTHTFQGLNADGKPSSRVLNPPGGSSSNIFGGLDEPQQRTPIRNNPDNVNRGNNDIFGQGQNAAAGPQQKSRAPRSAFNPITGEAYDQPQPKQEPLTPARSSSGSASSRTETVASGPLETSEPPTSDPVSSQEKSEPADENRSKSTDQEKPQPIDQEQPQPTDQEQLQPAAAPVPAQTAQQKRHQQQQSGVFGGTEDVKEHRSTRVSQPPGGRSTKLW